MGVRRAYTIDAYSQAFAARGYDPAENHDLEPGFVKIALYAAGIFPKHASRQCTDGWWASKLGLNVDIEHTFDALDGGGYGQVVRIFRKAL